MALTKTQKQKIKDLLSNKLEAKLKTYGREMTSKPFLARLIQDNEKIAAYSFIHFIASSLEMTILEEISVILASETADEAFRYYGVGGVLSKKQKFIIDNIVTKLKNSKRQANIKKEKKEVLSVIIENAVSQEFDNIADFYMKRNGEEYYFEIKTVKPNIDVFEKSKTKLLEWVARRRKPVNVFLAFPYNPYHPEPYSRFTESGMMDSPNDFLVGDEYWDFIGGKGTFPELLKTFDEVGKYFKEQLNQKFKDIAKDKLYSY